PRRTLRRIDARLARRGRDRSVDARSRVQPPRRVDALDDGRRSRRASLPRLPGARDGEPRERKRHRGIGASVLSVLARRGPSAGAEAFGGAHAVRVQVPGRPARGRGTLRRGEDAPRAGSSRGLRLSRARKACAIGSSKPAGAKRSARSASRKSEIRANASFGERSARQNAWRAVAIGESIGEPARDSIEQPSLVLVVLLHEDPDDDGPFRSSQRFAYPLSCFTSRPAPRAALYHATSSSPFLSAHSGAPR